MGRKRTRQIKIWLSEKEYELLISKVNRGGYENITDFLLHTIDSEYRSVKEQRADEIRRAEQKIYPDADFITGVKKTKNKKYIKEVETLVEKLGEDFY